MACRYLRCPSERGTIVRRDPGTDIRRRSSSLRMSGPSRASRLAAKRAMSEAGKDFPSRASSIMCSTTRAESATDSNGPVTLT